MDHDERMEVIVLGRKLGTASGWDEVGDQDFAFYGFVPYLSDKKSFLAGDLFISFTTGKMQIQTENGVSLREGDIVAILQTYPPDSP